MKALRGGIRRLLLGLAVATPASARAQAIDAQNKAPSSWHFQLSGTGTWNQNAYFLGADSNTDAWSTEGSATLSHVSRFRRGAFTLSGFGGAIYYPDLGDFNQPTYGGSLGLNWVPSRRTTLTLGQSYTRTNTRSMSAADAAGLPLPTSGTDFATSSLGLKQRLSHQWQLSMDANFAAHRYDDPRLIGGDQASVGANLQHQVGPQGAFYLGYGYSSAWFESDAKSQSSQQLLLGGRRKVEHGVSFELAGGVGYVDVTQSFYPSGRAGLTAAGRHASLALLYFRDFGQAWGYGRTMIGDMASAIFGWSASRRLSINAGYNFGYRRDPADESYTIISSIASAGFSWRVGGGVSLGANYAWEHNDTQGQPVVEGSRVGVSLSYGVDWR